ncbi:uncharacterized protein LOC123967298 isoform X1 [Micropterus dolomieu]|uniref:uncharacterized protein LOC123967298 isoform X1 n=1 Tax=Micropterus dolomieu TaxID=147949 RepID=UPI001E8EB4CB|nr:uncharacterized protein LOC123967298 isoform X1 [Micropterus dolomieu]
MKVTAPAMSRQAFLKMLEHRSVQAGRAGSICADTFQQSFFEFTFCQYIEEETCQVHHFECPACSPDMLAVCSDGNPKHYRFSKSKGTEEPPIYEDGTAKFTAGREISKRHGFLLRGLNHYRGEIFAYPMFLLREMSKKANVTFFCVDVTCRYWPYLNNVAEGLPELLPLTEMRPFLSVMQAKAHTAKCSEMGRQKPGWSRKHSGTGSGAERVYTPGCTEELRADIDNVTVTLLRKTQDLYRQHDSNQEEND